MGLRCIHSLLTSCPRGRRLCLADAKREIGALKLNCYKIGMDPNIISSASMLVHHELFAEFVDKNGNVNCTDEEELHVWKSVMERLLF